MLVTVIALSGEKIGSLQTLSLGVNIILTPKLFFISIVESQYKKSAFHKENIAVTYFI